MYFNNILLLSNILNTFLIMLISVPDIYCYDKITQWLSDGNQLQPSTHELGSYIIGFQCTSVYINRKVYICGHCGFKYYFMSSEIISFIINNLGISV